MRRIVVSLVCLLLSCTAHRVFVPAFSTLPPDLQAKVRAHLNLQPGQDPDPEWQRIVRATCKKNAFANCVCCSEHARECNPTSWQCCGSAVFGPMDGSSCSTPSPCGCTPPPASAR